MHSMGNRRTAKFVDGTSSRFGAGRTDPPVSRSRRWHRDSGSLGEKGHGVGSSQNWHNSVISFSARSWSKAVKAWCRAISIMLSSGLECARPKAKSSVFSKVTFCSIPNLSNTECTAFAGGGGIALARSSGKAAFSSFSCGSKISTSSLVQRGFRSFTTSFAAASRSEFERVMTPRWRLNEWNTASINFSYAVVAAS